MQWRGQFEGVTVWLSVLPLWLSRTSNRQVKVKSKLVCLVCLECRPDIPDQLTFDLDLSEMIVQALEPATYFYLPWTMSRALLTAVPATLAAVHWNQALSSGLAAAMCSDDRPPSVSMR